MQPTIEHSWIECEESGTESPRTGGLCQIGEALSELLSIYAIEVDVKEGAPWSDAEEPLADEAVAGELAYSTSRA